MSKTYSRADESVTEMGRALIERFHPQLQSVGVHIDYLFAYGDDDLMCAGYPCYAFAKIIGLAERALGQGDGRITIDHGHWVEMDHDTRIALLDHELHHFAVKRDKHGTLDRDDLDRPKLYMRKHDVQLGWFDVIAARHGKASIEVKQAEKLMDRAGQLYWPELLAGGGNGNLDLDFVQTGKRQEDPTIAVTYKPGLDIVRGVRDLAELVRKSGAKVTISTGGESFSYGGEGETTE